MIDNDPKYLYRYRHLQGDHREWTLRIISKSELYFASPKSFNDPFDCRIRYRQRVLKSELRKKHKQLVKKFLPDLNRTQRRLKVKNDIKRTNQQDLLLTITEGLQESVDNLGVLSLSANPTNILLWSHYASSHTGLCFKFRATNNTPFFGCAQKVNYESDYPVIDLLKDDPGKQTDAFLLTKAIDWHYEDEWRIIDHNSGSGYKYFPKELLVGVIFGARMPNEDKEAIAKELGDRVKTTQIEEAAISDDSYSIEIKPYRP